MSSVLSHFLDSGIGMADMGKLDTQDSVGCHLKTVQNSTSFDFSQISCQEEDEENQTKTNLASFGLQLGLVSGLLSFFLAIMLWKKRRRVRNDTQQGLL